MENKKQYKPVKKGWWSHMFSRKVPLFIAPYDTYGTTNLLYLRGRILEDKNIRQLKEDGWWEVLKNTYKRFITHEKPNIQVTASLHGKLYHAISDEEGYFKIDKSISSIPLHTNQSNLIPVYYHLKNHPEITAKSNMFIPSFQADYGIISDIDDTIMHTHVTSFLKLKMLYKTFFKAATSREPLLGASAFYQQLAKGKTDKSHNPFFYISNSPWNLYNYLRLFLKESNFPYGPMLLRDFAFPWNKNFRNEKNHKQREIRNIFRTYPWLRFILIGDSAEHDASIYADVAKEFPQQVICIYLHIVDSKSRMNRVHDIIAKTKHVNIVLVNNAKEAEKHAKEHGIIPSL